MNILYLSNRLPIRMIGFGILIIVCLLITCPSTSAIRQTQPAGKNLIQTFKKELERLRKEFRIPGLSVAVLQDRQVVFADGFGYADIENEIPATANTPYNIASLTKPFAATVLMKLVEEDRLNLDSEMAGILKNSLFTFFDGNIQGYAGACEKINEIGKDASFPFASLFRDYNCDTLKITLRHHLTHTAQETPGETYRYNGFLYGLLSLAAEEASGKSFADLLVENIIRPLKMTRTVPSINDNLRDKVLAERTKYYRLGDAGNFVLSEWPSKEIVKALEAKSLNLTPGLNAGAGMISTVLDLAKFDIAMDRNLIVSQESKNTMFTPTVSNSGQPLPYGLGWFVQEHMGVKIVWHYGWAPNAYSSLILKVPGEDATLILLANSEGASAPFRLGDGNVLTSPFAILFFNLFTKFEVKPSIPILGAITHVLEPDNSHKTNIDVIIGKGFTGNLPNDIDTITVIGPKGELPIIKDDFLYVPQFRYFGITIPGSPETGTYTVTVKSGNMSGSTTDTQSVLKTITFPDDGTFSPAKGAILRTNTPTFSWGAVKADVPMYYRFEINKIKGGRVYSTGSMKNKLSHKVPDGILKPGKAYRWRVRVTDDDNWIKVQNRSNSKWQSFTMSKALKYGYQIPKKNRSGSKLKPYFPPTEDEQWARISPQEAGWNKGLLDEAFKFARNNNTIQFLILYQGRILKEAYWGSTPEMTGDVASVQKSLVSILVGMAQEKGLLSIHEPVSRYIGSGWTRMNTTLEQQITLYHLLSMTTGMDSWLKRASGPGGAWSYNTPAYHYLKKVLEAVTQQGLHTLTEQWITKPLGMKSTSWIDRVYMKLPDGTPMSGLHTNVRDLARFGLLVLADGKWAGKTIIKDKAYLKEALSPSQDMNAAYGYLWWLNGRSHYMLHISKRTRKGYLVPSAPADMVAAYGVKAQKLYIVPSLSIVVARRGGAPTGAANSSFDNRLWEQLMHAAPLISER